MRFRTLFGIFLLCFSLVTYAKETFSLHGVSFDIPKGWKTIDSENEKDYFYRYLEKTWHGSEAITINCAITDYESDTEEWLRDSLDGMSIFFSFDFSDLIQGAYGKYTADTMTGKGKFLGMFLETEMYAYAFQSGTTSCIVIEQAETKAYKKSKTDFTVFENSFNIVSDALETETGKMCKPK